MNVSLSAYIFGVAQNTAAPPLPPQPNIAKTLPPELQGTVTDSTRVELLTYIERGVDPLEGGDF